MGDAKEMADFEVEGFWEVTQAKTLHFAIEKSEAQRFPKVTQVGLSRGEM